MENTHSPDEMQMFYNTLLQQCYELVHDQCVLFEQYQRDKLVQLYNFLSEQSDKQIVNTVIQRLRELNLQEND